MKNYRAGIDIGSTTVKLVVLDDHNKIIYGNYCRHGAHTQKTLAELLIDAKQKLGGYPPLHSLWWRVPQTTIFPIAAFSRQIHWVSL